jgi:hypothetical protein
MPVFSPVCSLPLPLDDYQLETDTQQLLQEANAYSGTAGESSWETVWEYFAQRTAELRKQVFDISDYEIVKMPDDQALNELYGTYINRRYINSSEQ